MIELDEFGIPAKDFFWMTFRSKVTHVLWFMAYLMILPCALTIVSGDLTLLIVLSVVVPVMILFISFFQARFLAYSKKNQFILQKRKWTFENGTYHVVVEDGSEGRGPLNSIIKADISCGYYRLFMTNMYYVPIPVTAFRSEEDRILFETEILGGKMDAKARRWKKIVVFFLVSVCLLGAAYAFRMYAGGL